jgi:hypothetical protein
VKSHGNSKSNANGSSSVHQRVRRQFSPRASAESQLEQHENLPSRVTARTKQDLWIAPKTSLSRWPAGNSWGIHPAAPSHARLLELADIALGVRKPEAFRRRRSLFLSAQSEKQQ